MRKIRAPKNLTQLAYGEIKGFILRGEWNEGERLTEERLVKKLGVSKSPIREALTRIESEGLLRIEPRRGAYVPSFSSREIAELYGLREAIETYAVLQAEVTPAVVAELERNIARLREHDNQRALHVEDDKHFHRTIVVAAGNRKLLEAWENLRNQAALMILRGYDISHGRAANDHHAILRCLKEGREKDAEALLRAHIRMAAEDLMTHVSKRNHGTPASGTMIKLRAAGR